MEEKIPNNTEAEEDERAARWKRLKERIAGMDKRFEEARRDSEKKAHEQRLQRLRATLEEGIKHSEKLKEIMAAQEAEKEAARAAKEARLREVVEITRAARELWDRIQDGNLTVDAIAMEVEEFKQRALACREKLLPEEAEADAILEGLTDRFRQVLSRLRSFEAEALRRLAAGVKVEAEAEEGWPEEIEANEIK